MVIQIGKGQQLAPLHQEVDLKVHIVYSPLVMNDIEVVMNIVSNVIPLLLTKNCRLEENFTFAWPGLSLYDVKYKLL